jgi:hypothetical protein
LIPRIENTLDQKLNQMRSFFDYLSRLTWQQFRTALLYMYRQGAKNVLQKMPSQEPSPIRQNSHRLDADVLSADALPDLHAKRTSAERVNLKPTTGSQQCHSHRRTAKQSEQLRSTINDGEISI